nr:TIGR03936 family radical SAM-associated protein [Lachnospiraceae bacterium]
AKLPMRYSEGLSPHQIMSFALPLSVGATSDGEYLDMSLTSELPPAGIVTALNRVMHEGIEAKACELLPEHAPKAMTVIAAAKYRLILRDHAILSLYGTEGCGESDPSEEETSSSESMLAGDESLSALRLRFAQEFRAHLSGQELMVVKKTKKGEQQLDIRPLIHEYTLEEDGTLEALLHAGSKDHVKPALLYESFFAARGRSFDASMLVIHRMDLYEETENGGFRPLIG